MRGVQLELLYTTFPELQAAEHACKTLLDERLTACVNIFPHMTSMYRWEGKLERASEVGTILKTDSARLPKLMERLKAIHPYKVPCMVCLDVKNADVAYLSWLKTCLEPKA